MYDYLKPLLRNTAGTTILHIITNNFVNNALNKIVSLKQCIKKILPEIEIIIFIIIERLYKGKQLYPLNDQTNICAPLK